MQKNCTPTVSRDGRDGNNEPERSACMVPKLAHLQLCYFERPDCTAISVGVRAGKMQEGKCTMPVGGNLRPAVGSFD